MYGDAEGDDVRSDRTPGPVSRMERVGGRREEGVCCWPKGDVCGAKGDEGGGPKGDDDGREGVAADA